MVIKKPYAFLIKHFRLIHGLLFAMLVFLTFKSITIYGFFNDYATNHTYMNQYNMASIYVTPLMYLITVVAILVLFVIYFILSVKEKSNRIYLAGILYYIVLFIFYIYIHSVFAGLEEKVLDIEAVRMFRDISLIVLLPQIVFLFIMFGRTLGFNIKQFEFKKDLEELEIDVTDNEEVELTLGNDTYKIARSFRKFLRLTKYFMIENKLFVIAMSSIIILGLSIFIYSRVNVYQEIHRQEEEIWAKSLAYNITGSYITKGDLNNEIINEKYSYVLVNLNVENKSNEEYNLNRDSFRLEVNKELLLPTFDKKEKFIDIGTAFEPSSIKGGDTKNFVVVFEVDNSYVEKEFLFKIKNITYDKNGNNTYYKDIVIKPYDLNTSIDKGTFKMPNKIDLSDSILKNSTLEIKKYEIADSFKESYPIDIEGKIRNITYFVKPGDENMGLVTILKLNTRLSLDDSIYLKKVVDEPADLLEMYGVIRYRYMGEYISRKLIKKDVNYDKQNYSYFEIPIEVKDSTKVDLIILVRGIKYTINLK